MMGLVIVVGYVGLNSFIKFKPIICRTQKDIIVLQGLPEPFDPYIVQGPAFAVHRDLDAFLFQILSPQRTGVLRPLIGVEYSGLPCTLMVSSSICRHHCASRELLIDHPSIFLL